MTLSEGKLKRMKALANRAGVIAAAAMDQRGSLQKSLAAAKGVRQEADHRRDDERIQDRRHEGPHASRQRHPARSGVSACPATKARAQTPGCCWPTSQRLRQHAARPPARSAAPCFGQAHRGLGRGRRQDPDLLHAFDDAGVNDIKHAFIERIGAECEAVRYSVLPGIRRLRSDRAATKKAWSSPRSSRKSSSKSMEEFSKPQYIVDVLKVEVPINAEYVEGSSVYKGQKAYTRGRSAATTSEKRRPWRRSRSSI